MKVAILGTRGIPNAYGGFEQFAQYLSLGLVQEGHDVTVYNSSTHFYRESDWNNVKIVHCYDPESKIGTIGQFIYDLNCILDCKRRDFDIILQLGYTSSSVWFKLLKKNKAVLITNMDGLEWKRSKYFKPVQQFLKYAELLAVRHSNYLIADSVVIQTYLNCKYNADSHFLAYGADIFNNPQENVLKEYQLFPYSYGVLIARLEPENSIEIILQGVSRASTKCTFLVIGNDNTKYGTYLKKKFNKFSNIRFLGSIYDINILNNIRYYSNLYFHGHTVGGTNPSLLEAMASNALICAHNNAFNRSVLGNDAHFFNDANEVTQLLKHQNKYKKPNQEKIKNNIEKIESTYSWSNIISEYIHLFKCVSSKEEIIGQQPELTFIKTKTNNALIFNGKTNGKNGKTLQRNW